MWKGVIVVYFIVVFCYFFVVFIGFKIFGNNVEENILILFYDFKVFIIFVNMFVVVYFFGSY